MTTQWRICLDSSLNSSKLKTSSLKTHTSERAQWSWHQSKSSLRRRITRLRSRRRSAALRWLPRSCCLSVLASQKPSLGRKPRQRSGTLSEHTLVTRRKAAYHLNKSAPSRSRSRSRTVWLLSGHWKLTHQSRRTRSKQSLCLKTSSRRLQKRSKVTYHQSNPLRSSRSSLICLIISISSPKNDQHRHIHKCRVSSSSLLSASRRYGKRSQRIRRSTIDAITQASQSSRWACATPTWSYPRTYSSSRLRQIIRSSRLIAVKTQMSSLFATQKAVKARFRHLMTTKHWCLFRSLLKQFRLIKRCLKTS